MKRLDVEEWAYRTIELVEGGNAIEDDRVELKAHFPEPKEIARQLAGHANASRGEPVLWLFGVDEKKGVVDVQLKDMADWHSRLEAEFEGGAPQVQHYTLIWKDRPFAALLFSSDVPPYVVRNPKRNEPNSGPFDFEVPWRDGGTRSARRAELILLLRPMTRIPSVEPTDGDVAMLRDGTINFNVHFYLAVETLSRIIVRSAVASIDLGTVVVPLTGFNVHPDGDDPDVVASRSHLTINGAGRISCNGLSYAPVSLDYSQELIFEVRLKVAAAEREAVGQARLKRVGPDPNMYARWLLR